MSNLTKSQAIKNLKTRLTKADTDFESVKTELKQIQERYNTAKKLKESLETELKNIKSFEPSVSEHALLRCIERQYSVNIEDLSEMILTDDVKNIIMTIQSGEVPILHGSMMAVVKNMEIVTIK